ncbi:MAG: DNA-binding protein [Clostridia bacterium]|nr:DNA-binding protein [Clostridia bacterium]
MRILGIDTSNYTTSLAVFDTETGKTDEQRIVLSAGDGLGLRQSEAHFNHTKNLPSLFEKISKGPYGAVGVSARPRNAEGSYMPCFLAGISAACAAASASNAPLYSFSHQEGHIAAAIYGIGKTELFEKGSEFFAFHLSGGTTELLKVISNGAGFSVNVVCETLDISAGQALDRTGKMLGFSFPSGKKVDELSLKSNSEKYLKCYKNGNFNFSGLENKAAQMQKDKTAPEDISKYVLLSIAKAIEIAVSEKTCGTVIMSGGVTGSKLLRSVFSSNKNVYFAPPSLSCDNAVGTAILAALKGKELQNE